MYHHLRYCIMDERAYVVECVLHINYYCNHDDNVVIGWPFQSPSSSVEAIGFGRRYACTAFASDSGANLALNNSFYRFFLELFKIFRFLLFCLSSELFDVLMLFSTNDQYNENIFHEKLELELNPVSSTTI